MIGFSRLVLFGFLFLTLLHLLIWVYARMLRRQRLENEWEAEGRSGDHDAYIAEGMAEYERSLQRRLIWLVYVIPIVAALAIYYAVNVR